MIKVVISQIIGDASRLLHDLIAEEYPVKRAAAAALSPHLTRHVERFGDYVINLQSFTIDNSVHVRYDSAQNFPLYGRGISDDIPACSRQPEHSRVGLTTSQCQNVAEVSPEFEWFTNLDYVNPGRPCIRTS
jgi:hypothetical protein